jgi:membrane fusion protein (multidrug efflux system)
MRVAILLALLFAGCGRPPAIPEEPPPLPVRLEAVKRASFQPTLTLMGVVRPSGEAEVVAPAAGRLRYPARFPAGLSTGTEVRAGKVLARLFNPQQELHLAEARLLLDAARSELDRNQRAFEAGLISAAHLSPFKVEADLAARRLTAAQQQLGSLDLRSPVAGRLMIDRRLPAEGEVTAGTVIARVAAGGALRVEGRAAAADRGRLRPGLTVRFVTPGSPEPTGHGVLQEIAPLVEAGGTVPLVVQVIDGTGLPVPGEGVEMRVELDLRTQAVTVPEEALVVAEGGSAVYVVKARAGLAQRRPVTTGERGGGRIEVLTGLSPGERLVVEGTALLTDGAPVTQVVEAKNGRAPESGR